MRSLPLPLPVRLLAAAFVLAAFAALPGRAEATCGSHVIILRKTAPPPVQPSEPVPIPTCHGPNCGRVPAPTPLPIGVTEAVPPELKQQSPFGGLPDNANSSTAFGHPTSAGKPHFSPTSIFHPPR
jgi:hypothetical protein